MRTRGGAAEGVVLTPAGGRVGAGFKFAETLKAKRKGLGDAFALCSPHVLAELNASN